MVGEKRKKSGEAGVLKAGVLKALSCIVAFDKVFETNVNQWLSFLQHQLKKRGNCKESIHPQL